MLATLIAVYASCLVGALIAGALWRVPRIRRYHLRVGGATWESVLAARGERPVAPSYVSLCRAAGCSACDGAGDATVCVAFRAREGGAQ